MFRITTDLMEVTASELRGGDVIIDVQPRWIEFIALGRVQEYDEQIFAGGASYTVYEACCTDCDHTQVAAARNQYNLDEVVTILARTNTDHSMLHTD